MAVEDELGTSDEIKEFKHEGELDSQKDSLADIKQALAMSADKPPLAAALDVSNLVCKWFDARARVGGSWVVVRV